MKVTRHSFAADPGDIVREKWDCIWVHFATRKPKSPSPLKSPALQWIDWRMHGALSRFLIREEQWRYASATFIPTMRRIAAPFLALEPAEERAGIAAFARNCEGLSIQNLLVFCEDAGDLDPLKKAFAQSPSAKAFPAAVVLGSD